MEITSINDEGRHELQLQGRLDANWADRVGQAIETAIQSGHHHLDLDFARVDYVSSAGIRELLKYHKKLKAVRGRLRVLRPTASVLEVLHLAGIADMLVAKQEPGESSTSSAAAAAVPPPRRPRSRGWNRFWISPQNQGRCTLA